MTFADTHAIENALVETTRAAHESLSQDPQDARDAREAVARAINAAHDAGITEEHLPVELRAASEAFVAINRALGEYVAVWEYRAA